MPFIALTKATGERIDITRAPADLVRQFAPGDLVCQLCGGPMFPRSAHKRLDTSGEKYDVRAHFVHVAKECESTYGQLREPLPRTTGGDGAV